MNALDILRRDHQRVQSLIAKVEDTLDKGNASAFAGVVQKLDDALKLHFRIAEDVFYNELEGFDEVRELIADGRETHRRIDEVVNSLKENEPIWIGQDNRFAVIKELMRQHITQEEDLGPEAERLLGATALQEMSYEMDEIRTHQSATDSMIYPASRLGPKPI
jgi:hypothetical protein